jgi:outer membrane immunogenic protein
MRKSLLASVALGALAWGGAAEAADLPVKAPPAPVAVPWSWTGFYIGGNLGYSVGVDRTTQGSAFPDGNVNIEASFNEAPHGALAGGQIGYNWQFAPHWVVGAEADWQWSDQHDFTCNDVCPPVTNGPAIPLTQDQRLRDFGTARVRFGYAQDRWLWYATGGFAWGRVDQSYAINEVTPSFVFGGSVSSSHDRTGWTAGLGVETALWAGWSAKLEYLYVDLGSVSDTFNVPDPPGVAVFTTQSNVRDHVIRAGVNYRFGAPDSAAYTAAAGPALVYKAPPGAPATVGADWSGFYLGGNVGYSIGLNPTTEALAEPTALGFSGGVGSVNTTPTGWLGGGQAGYNWQFASQWVLGAEADWQWSGERDSICVFFCASNSGAEPLTVSQRLRDFGTARARFGYAQDRWLWYATGGVAWGTMDQTYAFSAPFLPPVPSVSTSHGLTGWAVGAGVETALGASWSAKLEYLYLDLGSIADTLVPFGPATSFTTQSNIRDNVVRVGVDYKFGSSGSVAAKY